MSRQPELSTERDVPPNLSNAAKRDLVDAELRKDAGRSDREIARLVGCDHKTVGAPRANLSPCQPIGLGDAVAASTAPAATIVPAQKPFDPWDPKEQCIVVPEQQAIAAYVNTRNMITLQQPDPSDSDDDIIVVAYQHVPRLIAKLQELQAELGEILRDEGVLP